MHFPQGVAVENAECCVSQCDHAIASRIEHALLHADERASQQNARNLPASIAQGPEPKGPATQERVQHRIDLALMNECFPCEQADFTAFQRLHQFHIFGSAFEKQWLLKDTFCSELGPWIPRLSCTNRVVSRPTSFHAAAACRSGYIPSRSAALCASARTSGRKLSTHTHTEIFQTNHEAFRTDARR